MIRTNERQRIILEIAQNNGFASISDIAQKINVSIETIRRDINVLCEKKQLRKVRGGATPIKVPLRRDSNYFLRIRENQQAKITIGREAAKMIHDGDVVALDCGVSIQSLASCIADVCNVTFVTNSLPTAMILMDKFEKSEISGRLIMIGGEIDLQNRFSKSAHAIDEVDRYHFDIAFVSCTALSQEGVSSFSMDESTFSKHLMARSSCAVLIAESEKFEKNSVCTFATLSDFDCVITDDQSPVCEAMQEELNKSKVKLIVTSSQA